MEHTASVPASTLDHFSSAWLANVSGLAWKMFTGERRLRANAYASLSSSLSLFLSPFHPPSDGLIGETRNEKSAGTKSAKLRPILVVDSTPPPPPPPQVC